MVPQDIHLLIPGTCEYVKLHSEGEVGIEMEWKVLICGLQNHEIGLKKRKEKEKKRKEKKLK